MHTYRQFSRLVSIGSRLVILASMLMAAFAGGVMSVAAAPLRSLNTVTVGSQSGALSFGAAGDVTFDVSVTRTSGSPNTFSLSVSGLPAGAGLLSQSPGNPVGFTTNPQIVTLTIHFDGNLAAGAGSYNFTVLANGSSGPSRSGTGTLVIDKASQTITFGPLSDMTLGDPDFPVSATASSGLAVTFTAGGACTVNGTTVSLTAVGYCWITASQAGDANYQAAPNVVQQFSVLPAAGAPATDIFDLYAVSGSTVMPDGAVVPVWGYSVDGSAVTQPGGPLLTTNQDDTVVIRLHNDLAVPTSLLIQGQDMVPDTTGVIASLTKSYIFTASKPGTYLYEAGLMAGGQYQVAMGLYGALIVNPSTPNQAYGDASTAYDAQDVLVLSEMDPALNTNVDPAAFDIRDYSPRYFLINGKAYPDTAPIDITPNQNVLLRYVNAGLQAHAMSTLGLSQNIIAQDGNPYLYSHKVIAETIATGETLDTIVAVPATAAAGSSFALYDANMLMHNTTAAGFGGMLAFMSIAGSVGPGGPTTSNVTLTPNISNGSSPVTLAATIGLAGDPDIDAAEYFVDTVGQDNTGCAITTGLGAAPASVNATIPTSGAAAPCADLTTLSSANHTFYVHGHNANGWGAVASALLNLDKTGPSILALQLSPNPSNGSVNVNLSFTASDVASGNSDVTMVEYWVDANAPQSFTFTAAPSVNLNAVIPSGLNETIHTVTVQATDALGNMGSATVDLIIDQTGPTTGNVTAAPNPNNGSTGINTSTPAVRVTASFNDTATNIAAAEGFIDLPPGTTGTGFVFVASDGNFNSLSEAGFADIPLASIGALLDGPHTISVHAKDAAGNWGGFSTTILTIDKTPPTITSATLTPNTIAFGAASVTLNVTANDGTGLGLDGGRYWIDGTGVPPATAIPFAGASAVINTSALAAGSHTVYVQMQDAVGNWSTTASASLYVILAVNDSRTITANGSATQTSDANAAAGVLTNDEPVGMAGRTASLASAPVRTSGSGAGTITLSCPATLGSPATPAIGGQTICTNGAYRVTLNGVGNNNNQRAASKRGTYQFTYTLTLNGVTSTATVIITVN